MSAVITSEPHRYRRWPGQLNKGRWTWLAIVVTGIRQAFREAKTRNLVMTSAFVMVGSCIILYVLSVLETVVGTKQAQGIYEFISIFLKIDISGVSRIEELRDRKSTRLNSSHIPLSRMPSSA